MAITPDHRVYLGLRDQVATLQYEPGAVLCVGNLAERLGVSSTPVREALIRLSVEDYIDYQRGRGFSIKKIRESYFLTQYRLIGMILGPRLEDLCLHDDAPSRARAAAVIRCALGGQAKPVPDGSGGGTADLHLGILALFDDGPIAWLLEQALRKTAVTTAVELSDPECCSAQAAFADQIAEALRAREVAATREHLARKLERRRRMLPVVVDRLAVEMNRRFATRDQGTPLRALAPQGPGLRHAGFTGNGTTPTGPPF